LHEDQHSFKSLGERIDSIGRYGNLQMREQGTVRRAESMEASYKVPDSSALRRDLAAASDHS